MPLLRTSSALYPPTQTLKTRVRSVSTQSGLPPGQRALTPIIAGSVCGGLLGIAWIVGTILYLFKRHKKKKQTLIIAAGLAEPKVKKTPKENVIIPPDPAIVLGHRLPGERAFKDEHESAKPSGSKRGSALAQGGSAQSLHTSWPPERNKNNADNLEMTLPPNV